MSLLEIDGLTVHHGQLPAIRDVSLRASAEETLAVIGANGAGKSTLLGAVAGVLRPTAGTIRFDGADVTHVPPHRRVQAGIALVPEGRRLFNSLTVEENLLVGAYRKRPGPWDLATVMGLFDWMKERSRDRCEHLSGGEQQAVAIGRALMSNPRLLLLDEVSLGLAPIVVRRLYETLPEILSAGTAVLIVEQDVAQAMRVGSEIVCLLEGRIALSGRAGSLTAAAVEEAYFGRSGSAVTQSTPSAGTSDSQPDVEPGNEGVEA
jgi:branched-chain amino acid transport system ATP-binding protein